ncbi:MAG: penicillin-binding protein 1C [Synergistaceae bacterium]|nr:penicillin-binding protein 1C [Synergistaceae bacterium]
MKKTKKNLILAFGAIIAILFSAGAWFWLYHYQNVPLPLHEVTDMSLISSPSIYDRNGTLFHVKLSPESEWSIPIPLDQMGKWLPMVAVGVEDKRFYSHFGIDALSIARAAFQNITARKIVSGASTITSQVIRLSITDKRTRDRNFSTKLTEFIQAIKLDGQLPKEKILEIYLNRAPFGGNIRGVEAASRVYFGKRAASVSPGEACLLIGMLVAPSRYRPDIRPENALKRRNAVIEYLRESGVFTAEQAQLALAERIPTVKRPLPFRAYHYSQRLLEESPPRFQNGRIDSGLDLNIQTALENTLRAAVVSLPQNITAAAGIIDNSTNQIVGWVGNARFDLDKTWGSAERTVPGAWVDCGLALRSPGSALKPFAWIAAFDAGKITPGTLLSDTPIAFSGRAPRNFDLTYRGAVSARVALADSLNAPSVRVLRLANQERVLELMRGSGLTSLSKSSSYYGDSLILGGCDIRLSELLEAYSAIAAGGEKYHGSRFFPPLPSPDHGNNSVSGRIFSEGAAWLISDILSDTRRLSFIARESLQFEGRKVAFKTGTSYGLRDAWTAAWTPRFTVAVWFGDPSGMGWDGLIGLNIAAPPAFSALRLASSFTDSSSSESAPSWFEVPPALEQRKLCSLSGKPPVNACPSTRNEWVIKNVTNMLPCDMHSMEGGKSVTTLPPELGFMASEPDGKRIMRRSALEIVSPISGGRYIISSVSRERQKIPFRAEGGYERLYWFIDGVFAGESSPALPLFYAPPPGRHDVSVMDSLGRTAATKVDVVTIEFQKEELLELR